VQRPRGRGVGELADDRHDLPPGRRSVIIASDGELVSSGSALLKRMFAVAFERQLGRTPNVDLRYHAAKVPGRRSMKI
jgi:hypothetical protein